MGSEMCIRDRILSGSEVIKPHCKSSKNGNQAVAAFGRSRSVSLLRFGPAFCGPEGILGQGLLAEVYCGKSDGLKSSKGGFESSIQKVLIVD